MHPAMAVWIWSMAMARVWQTSMLQPATLVPTGFFKDKEAGGIAAKRTHSEPRLVLANEYLQSEIAASPLPEKLLDRLAELYWTERDPELAI